MAETEQIPIRDFQMNDRIELAMQEMQREIMQVELLEAEHIKLAKELTLERQKHQILR
jgi:transcription antitermination factor NusA-like protein